jgi:hypothetical protein
VSVKNIGKSSKIDIFPELGNLQFQPENQIKNTPKQLKI